MKASDGSLGVNVNNTSVSPKHSTVKGVTMQMAPGPADVHPHDLCPAIFICAYYI